MLVRGLRAMTAVALLLALSAMSPRAVAALTFPGWVTSWYMDTVNTTTVYNMGCALGTARSGGSAPQDSLVILDFGQPSWDSEQGYGAWAFDGLGYVSVTAIRNAVVEFAHGFWVCTGTNTTAHVTIAIGTSNNGNWTKTSGFTDAMVQGHARAWAATATLSNNDILARGYQRQASAVAAADIELGWGSFATAKLWIDAFDTNDTTGYDNYGDAAGCRTSGTTRTAAVCTGDWGQDDVYYGSYGAPPAWAVPEIYRTDAVQAKQWQQVSKWATLNSKPKISFTGSLTQQEACAQTPGCSGSNLDNSPSAGWTQLVTQTATDSATALSRLQFAADIKKRWFP